MKTKDSMFLFAALTALMGVAGCHRNTPAATPQPVVQAPEPDEPAPIDPADLKKAKVNEAGVVPILEYHDVGPTENPNKYIRSIENFRKDLQRLYDEGY